MTVAEVQFVGAEAESYIIAITEAVDRLAAEKFGGEVDVVTILQAVLNYQACVIAGAPHETIRKNLTKASVGALPYLVASHVALGAIDGAMMPLDEEGLPN